MANIGRIRLDHTLRLWRAPVSDNTHSDRPTVDANGCSFGGKASPGRERKIPVHAECALPAARGGRNGEVICWLRTSRHFSANRLKADNSKQRKNKSIEKLMKMKQNYLKVGLFWPFLALRGT